MGKWVVVYQNKVQTEFGENDLPRALARLRQKFLIPKESYSLYYLSDDTVSWRTLEPAAQFNQDSKLLTCTNLIPENIRQQWAIQNKDVDYIIDNIFLGAKAGLGDLPENKFLVISLVGIDRTAYQQPKFIGYQGAVNPSHEFDHLQAFYKLAKVAENIKAANCAGHNVFIHCKDGVQRSVGVLLQYLMEEKEMLYSEAKELVWKNRPGACLANIYKPALTMDPWPAVSAEAEQQVQTDLKITPFVPTFFQWLVQLLKRICDAIVDIFNYSQPRCAQP